MQSKQQTPVARREQFTGGFLPPRQTPLIRALRDALAATVRDLRPRLRNRQLFDNAASPDRSCPSDRLALMVDDALDALRAIPASEMSAEQKLEQALALPRTLEGHIRARLAPAPALSPKEHALRVSRTDAAGDMTMAEYLANPNDPSIALRAADMAEREGREHLGFADQIRVFFHRPTSQRTA